MTISSVNTLVQPLGEMPPDAIVFGRTEAMQSVRDRLTKLAGANVPVVCDGVAVNALDIVVADADGVVVVPRASATEALKLAQDLDFKEHSMYAYIEKLKSIEEAVKKFGRL